MGSRGDEHPQLTQAEDGQVIFLDEAEQLVDNQGNKLEWTEIDDTSGALTADGTDTEFYTYVYSISPERQKAKVTMVKTPKSDKEVAKAKAKLNGTEVPKASKDEQKAIKDAEEVAKYAPNEKTKKEAQSISKTY